MSSQEVFGIVYPRYRGTYSALPYPDCPNQLEAVIEERVKPGLEKLSETVKDNLVDYLGYCFAPIIIDGSHLRERPDNTDWHERTRRDDFHISSTNLFRWMHKSGHTRSATVQRDLVFGLPGINQLDFVLGPAVSRLSSVGPTDEWGQLKHIDLTPSSAVMVSGRVLLEAMASYDDAYRHRFEITPKQMADFFTSAYEMKALHEDFMTS